jgi:hypothetical protein
LVAIGTIGNVAVADLAFGKEGEAFDVKSVFLANFSDE